MISPPRRRKARRRRALRRRAREKFGDRPKVPAPQVDSSRAATLPSVHTNPKRERGSFPHYRKDLRQTSLTLRVSMNRRRECQVRDAVNPRVLGRSQSLCIVGNRGLTPRAIRSRPHSGARNTFRNRL